MSNPTNHTIGNVGQTLLIGSIIVRQSSSISSYHIPRSNLEVPSLKAAIYARVSTEDQAKEGFSIAAQLKRLNAYCKARDWEISHEYVDNGHSGRETKRPAYQSMMAERDSWDVLVVLKMDRIHRNSQNFTTMMEELSKWGKEFNSMQESFDTTTAMGRFVMDIIQRIAQLESEQIGERVKMGMIEKAEIGDGYLGFSEPYGYTYHDGELIVDEKEASVVREIFSMYLTGWTLQKIADHLNGNGVPSKRLKQWSKQSVGRILKNPLYCGHVRWDGIIRQGRHRALVNPEDFNRTQLRMRKSIRNKSRLGKSIRIKGEIGETFG
jgi:site-specific DNA recombinase